jgi:hypothetical protein
MARALGESRRRRSIEGCSQATVAEAADAASSIERALRGSTVVRSVTARIYTARARRILNLRG